MPIHDLSFPHETETSILPMLQTASLQHKKGISPSCGLTRYLKKSQGNIHVCQSSASSNFSHTPILPVVGFLHQVASHFSGMPRFPLLPSPRHQSTHPAALVPPAQRLPVTRDVSLPRTLLSPTRAPSWTQGIQPVVTKQRGKGKEDTVILKKELLLRYSFLQQ